MSQWLYFKEWRNSIPEKQQDDLKTPIIDYAKIQLDHIFKELKRDLGPKVDLEPSDYYRLIAKIRRALDTGLYFGGLFDSQKRLIYRQFLVDILDGIRELQVNDYIYELLLENHKSAEMNEWLSTRNQSILEAIAETRKSFFKVNPYWV